MSEKIISRCNGYIYANPKQVCPQRDNCIRFSVSPKGQKQVFVAGSDQVGDCTEFLSVSKSALSLKKEKD